MAAPGGNEDWRLGGQERYLTGLTLFWRTWRETRPGWDHDHCEFCWVEFAAREDPDIQREGYTTDDEYHWICADCARDFRTRFDFTLVGGPLAG
jgi:hypothetical protein